MTSRRILLVSAALLFLSSYQAIAQAQESVRVYESLFREFGQPNGPYVVLETPINPNDVLSTEREAILKIYRFPTKLVPHLKKDFGAASVHLLSDTEYVKMFSDTSGCGTGWGTFHEHFPEAKVLIELSPVAFRANDREALVVMKGSSGCLGGSVDLLVFARSGSSWKFKEATNVSRS